MVQVQYKLYICATSTAKLSSRPLMGAIGLNMVQSTFTEQIGNNLQFHLLSCSFRITFLIFIVTVWLPQTAAKIQ